MLVSEADSVESVMDTVVKIVHCVYTTTMNHPQGTELLKEIKGNEFNNSESLPVFIG